MDFTIVENETQCVVCGVVCVVCTEILFFFFLQLIVQLI